MATFGQMKADLRLLTNGTWNDTTYGDFINRAHQQILEGREWTFLLTNAVINSVYPKSTGTVTISQGQTLVVGNGTAFGPEDIGAFIWFGGLQIAPVPIAEVSGPLMLTLAFPWSGPSQIATGYVSAPLYYLVEGADEVKAIRTNFNLLNKRSREALNAVDPARISQGGSPSTDWANAPGSPDGSVQVELWPVPSDTRPYLIEYKKRPPLLADDGDVPLCPSAVVEAKALNFAATAMYASTGQQSWKAMADSYMMDYVRELEDSWFQDQKRAGAADQLSSPASLGNLIDDSRFFPLHDITGPL